MRSLELQGPVESWPVVELGGRRWRVAPVYVAPVCRRDVEGICDAWGCEIPSAALVDAIWRAADVKLDPWRFARPPAHNSPEDHRRRVVLEIGSEPFALLAGSHKDFARMPDGRVDLYGWHTKSGDPIEKGRTSHNDTYCDYSQGIRPVQEIL